jgi:excisionase family DNA binding protein
MQIAVIGDRSSTQKERGKMNESTRRRADLLTVAEASEMLGIGQSAVRERIKRGELDAIKCGRRWRIPAKDLLQTSGLSKGVATYLCQYLVLSLRQHFTELLYKGIDDALARASTADKLRIEELNRQLGHTQAQLDAAILEVERLTGDIGAVVGELDRPLRAAERK